MVSFVISLVALVLGYLLYGKFVAHVFGPDDRPLRLSDQNRWGRLYGTALVGKSS